jgi:hypothetical protein
MKERPILFSGPMIRAILAGEKTQTRRVVKPQQSTPRVPPLTMEPYMWGGEQELDDHGLPCWIGEHPDYPTGQKWFSCPYGGVGDRLWVRETWGSADRYYQSHQNDTPRVVAYAADRQAIRWDAQSPKAVPDWDLTQWNWDVMKWRPSIFMPRAFSRLTLEIEAVRVERLQDISEKDAEAEGMDLPDCSYISRCNRTSCPRHRTGAYRYAFAAAWDTINGKRAAWVSNPWVWVVGFRKVL